MTTASRFRSLDVFRGLTVCFMIIVNMPGSYDTAYAPLLHAPWHGFTPTDLVFPAFLFAVGNALSFVAPKWQQLPPAQVLTKILKRSFLIFLLGYLMYWFPFAGWDEQGQLQLLPFQHTRVFGVLQRIALCYLFTALLVYTLKERTVYLVGALLLLLYWPLLYWFGSGEDPLSMAGNAVRRLDLWLLGPHHLYQGEGMPFDPEGLLSSLPAAVNVIGGYWAGRHFQRKGQTYEMLSQLLLAGLAMLALGYLWDWFFPINKKLWTSSYACYTIGLSTLLLAGIMYVMDFKKRQGGATFFEVFGKNPLFIYMLAELTGTLLWFFRVTGKDGQLTHVYPFLYQTLFEPIDPYLGSLLFALSYMLVMWSVGYLLHRKKIYIKV